MEAQDIEQDKTLREVLCNQQKPEGLEVNVWALHCFYVVNKKPYDPPLPIEDTGCNLECKVRYVGLGVLIATGGFVAILVSRR